MHREEGWEEKKNTKNRGLQRFGINRIIIRSIRIIRINGEDPKSGENGDKATPANQL